jgi:hypothetical protein
MRDYLFVLSQLKSKFDSILYLVFMIIKAHNIILRKLWIVYLILNIIYFYVRQKGQLNLHKNQTKNQLKAI